MFVKAVACLKEVHLERTGIERFSYILKSKPQECNSLSIKLVSQLRQHAEEILSVLGQSQGRFSSTRVLDLSYNDLSKIFPLLLDNLRFLNRAVLRGSLRRYKLVTSVLASLKQQGSRLKSLDISENPLSGGDGWLPPALLASSLRHLEQLFLQHVHFTDGQVHALFSSLPGTLKLLDLGEVDLSELPVCMLVKVAEVVEVNLTNTSLTKEQLEALLSTLPKVKKNPTAIEGPKAESKVSNTGDSRNLEKDTDLKKKDSGSKENISESPTKKSESGSTNSECAKDFESKSKEPTIIMQRLSLKGNRLSGSLLRSLS